MPDPLPNIADALKFKSLRENSFGSVVLKHPKFAQAKWAPRFIRFVNKWLYPIGVGGALNRYDGSLAFYASGKDGELYEGYAKDSIFVNFGSGAFQHPRWINYDYPGVSDYYKSIQGLENRDFYPIDLGLNDLVLPFKSGSVSLIYCAHTLEHLETEKAIHFLKECSRILKLNGALRVAVPNSESDFYFSSIIFSQDHIDGRAKAAAARSSASHLLASSNSLSDEAILEDLIESAFDAERYMRIAKQKRGVPDKFDAKNPGGHVSYWNHKNLSALARPCGFTSYLPLYRGSTTQAPFRNLDVFDTTEPHISLYGEFVRLDS